MRENPGVRLDVFPEFGGDKAGEVTYITGRDNEIRRRATVIQCLRGENDVNIQGIIWRGGFTLTAYLSPQLGGEPHGRRINRKERDQPVVNQRVKPIDRLAFARAQ